jgi:glucose-6-phosphate 1-epimerase
VEISELNHRFGLGGDIHFEEDRGLVVVHLTTPAFIAALYLQGAHVTHWQPKGTEPLIFLRRKSDFAPGKPIRGGIPIVFPWFATDSKQDRIDGHPGPSHGFARIQDWTVESATRHGDAISLRLTLGPTDMSRSMGFDHFLLTLEMVFGATLEFTMTARNNAAAPLMFEEAFHAYFHVMDVHETTVSGLEPTAFIDKTDNFMLKPPAGSPIHFSSPTDRVYANTEAALTIHDALLHRELRVEKRNSHTTVVFNPYKAMADLGEWEWHEMVCVETANVGSNRVTVAPGASHQMGMHVSVIPQAHGQ